MIAPRHILLLLLALSFFTTAAQAQLAFEPAAWDFGSIREADGRVSHTFTGVNRGDKPLVILDVVTSCGCTVPEFSRKPVVPGGSTRITVTFDPSNRPGTFAKDLAIYSTEREKVATLSVRGNVTPRPKSVEERYPVDAGGGLRLSATLCTFSYIHPGQQAQSSVNFINTAKHPVDLELRAQESSGLLMVDYPRRIASGEQGAINFSYLIPPSAPRYGTLRDAMEVRVDAKSNDVLLMTHGIGVDTPPARRAQSPVSELSANVVKFGTVKHAAPLQRQPFVLSNTGNGELIVRAVESVGKVTTTLRPGQKVPAGGSIRAEALLDPGRQDYGILSTHLILITNDPDRPMRRLRVTAIIEE